MIITGLQTTPRALPDLLRAPTGPAVTTFDDPCKRLYELSGGISETNFVSCTGNQENTLQLDLAEAFSYLRLLPFR